MAEKFSTPDEYGEIKASDIYRLEKAKIITDAHTFIVPLIWLGVAIVVWLIARGPARRLIRIGGLWLEAKERELSERAQRGEPPK